MKSIKIASVFLAVLAITGLGIWWAAPRPADAHCDTLDGPVVLDARAALDKGDVTPVLKWVTKENEEEVKSAFKAALFVRGKGPEAKEMADRWFFETLVRLHRAGEGAPFTGLKPAGAVEPPVAAADKAIAEGNADELAAEVGHAAEKGIRERFARLTEARKHKDENVDAGRRYVAAYIEYVHYVEALHNLIVRGASHEGHGEGAEPAEGGRGDEKHGH